MKIKKNIGKYMETILYDFVEISKNLTRYRSENNFVGPTK